MALGLAGRAIHVQHPERGFGLVPELGGRQHIERCERGTLVECRACGLHVAYPLGLGRRPFRAGRGGRRGPPGRLVAREATVGGPPLALQHGQRLQREARLLVLWPLPARLRDRRLPLQGGVPRAVPRGVAARLRGEPRRSRRRDLADGDGDVPAGAQCREHGPEDDGGGRRRRGRARRHHGGPHRDRQELRPSNVPGLIDAVEDLSRWSQVFGAIR
mmetsp:Transcript_317/g.622  ORF Transcript_317/g.622 Transcript_317/m.622 type:complete len:217 (-) Transcript_317:98-748(-)